MSSNPASVRVKICGTTTVQDALLAEDAGADAVGVVVCSDSPRSVPLDRACEIFASLGPFTTPVAVTHTTSVADLEAVFETRPAAVQLFHRFGMLPPYGGRIIQVVRKGEILPAACDAVAVDESAGTGKRFDLAFARHVIGNSPVPVVLCGGLNADNVAAAIRAVHPYAVDVCSGTEVLPGVKDPEKVRSFVRAVKFAGKNVYSSISSRNGISP
jgi:phosphoribosylanthranilate isomerase